jgi:hypothetical protein
MTNYLDGGSRNTDIRASIMAELDELKRKEETGEQVRSRKREIEGKVRKALFVWCSSVVGALVTVRASVRVVCVFLLQERACPRNACQRMRTS